jgi:2,4-dienoyl-CoA reductase-like NADH-dependent reductase (Old Yellow Enzyme family)
MSTNMPTEKGEVTPDLIEYYESRGHSLGLQIIEASCISDDSRFYSKQLSIASDEMISGLKTLVSSIKDTGACVAIQLAHGGAHSSTKLTGNQPMAPSNIPTRDDVETPRPMTEKRYRYHDS